MDVERNRYVILYHFFKTFSFLINLQLFQNHLMTNVQPKPKVGSVPAEKRVLVGGVTDIAENTKNPLGSTIIDTTTELKA